LEALRPPGERRHADPAPRPSRNPESPVGGNPAPAASSSLDTAAQSQAHPDVATPELLAFASGPHAIANYQPSTGTGLFDARYDDALQELVVTVRCAFRFLSGSQRRYPDANAGELAWDDASKAEWKKGFLETISSRWGARHAFRCTQSGLEALAATLRVEVLEAEKDWHYTTEQNFATLDSEDLTPTNKGGSEGQYGAVHEFGHMIGLGDEYGTGTDVAHATLVSDALGKQLARGDSDDVMSCAYRISPQHYVTFLEALKKATGVDAWSIAE
jgi:hypothetical protein